MPIRRMIESGDVEGLRRLLDLNPDLANALVGWGEGNGNRTHPLHFVSDMQFEGKLLVPVAVDLVRVLLQAGADVQYQAENGETALIGAASLLAEEVGLEFLRAGAKVEVRGGLGETALHWAAYTGLERLVEELLRCGADVTSRDTKYGATPLEWAEKQSQTGVIRILGGAGV